MRSQLLFLSRRISLVKFSLWSKFYVNIITGSEVVTIFDYKRFTWNIWFSYDFRGNRQKQPPEGFYEKGCSQNFCKTHRKTLAPKAWNFIKKETLARVFPAVNFAKFLGTPFLQNTSGRLASKQKLINSLKFIYLMLEVKFGDDLLAIQKIEPDIFFQPKNYHYFLLVFHSFIDFITGINDALSLIL